jgi:hypothetical protein
MPRVHHRYATVSGRRVFYREAGATDAPALVLLHGFPTSSLDYQREQTPETEQAIRFALTPEATRWQYVTGVPDETLVSPDTWERAAWSYPQAWPEVARIADFVSFEPDKIDIYLDDKKLALEPGQTVIPHGIDPGLDLDEILERA